MLAIILANLKMMARNRQGLFWALLFPLLLVVVFGLFDFRGVTPTGLAVADHSGGPKADLLRERLEGIALLEPEALDPDAPGALADARQRLEDGDLGYLLIIPQGLDTPAAENSAGAPEPVVLIYSTRNSDRNQLVEGAVHSLVIEMRSEGRPVLPEHLVESQVIETPEVDYFDTVLLGLLGLGIMTNSIISIAVRISTYRNQAVLKRLLATPLPVWKFFAGEIIAHLLLAIVQALIILAVGVFVFGGDIHGSPVLIHSGGMGAADRPAGVGGVPQHRLHTVRVGAQSGSGLGHGERGGPANDVPGRYVLLHRVAALVAALCRTGPAADPHARCAASGGHQQCPPLGHLAPACRSWRLGRRHCACGCAGVPVHLIRDYCPVSPSSR